MKEEIDFNHRVCLYKVNQVVGDFGETTTTFEEITSVWGKITPLQSNQNFDTMKQNVEILYSVCIRYFKEAKECKKIVFNNRSFDVISVICPEEDYNFLLFKVKEIF